ncbi:MAG: DoxX family protein [Ignavibacteriales bacterium]|nr:DoxX family protein [Ignavibacteriales bacterium]
MTNQHSSKALNIALWAAQIFLALVFFITGAAKLFLPIENLNALIPWTKDVNSLPVRLIGLSEIIGSLGLILPSLLRIKPQLTSLAAIGVAFVMLLATLFNISMGETSVIGINILLFLLAIFVAWGRFKKSLIPPRYPVRRYSLNQK